MAIYHLTAKWHTRSKNKKLRALRAYAYRAGARVVDPLNNRVYNSTNKKEVVFCETLLPPGAPEWMRDPIELWGRAVEGGERRRDSVIFTEWEGALPHDVGIEECKEIVRQFVSECMVGEGQVVTWALHDKPGNRHFHVMATTREIVDGKFGPKQQKWRQYALLYRTRESLATHINNALERAGLPQRVTHRSYADLGIDREPTVHVGPENFGKPDPVHHAKRQARLRNNRRVKTVYQQRSKRRRHQIRPALVAAVQGAKLTSTLRAQLDEAQQERVPVSPNTMSPEEQAAYKYLHETLPDADQIYRVIAQLRDGLGRDWNWLTFRAQFKRIEKDAPDLMDALLAKELIWLVSRAPDRIEEFSRWVNLPRCVTAAKGVRKWVEDTKPDLLHLIERMALGGEATSGSNSGISKTGCLTGMPAADWHAFEEALAPFGYLITDMAVLLQQCQQVAESIERKISPAILVKRLTRVLDGPSWPQNQGDLGDALMAVEVVFAAKRRQHRVAHVLDAVPPERRKHFEAMVASVLGDSVLDAGHAVAARALSPGVQKELQAQCNVRQVLSDFQLLDFNARMVAMKALGKAYTWCHFQSDIQCHASAEDGWQRAWWQAQADALNGIELSLFKKAMPKWFTFDSSVQPQTVGKQYPLGTYDSLTGQMSGAECDGPPPARPTEVIQPIRTKTHRQSWDSVPPVMPAQDYIWSGLDPLGGM